MSFLMPSVEPESSPPPSRKMACFPTFNSYARRCRLSVASVEDVSPSASTELGRPWTSGKAERIVSQAAFFEGQSC